MNPQSLDQPDLTQSLRDKDAEIALITAQLAAANSRLREAEFRLMAAEASRQRSQPEAIQKVFGSFGRNVRSLLVAKYHERLLPQILQLSASGVVVEVFESPKALASAYQGTLRFMPGTLWDWLAGINSLFNEKAYLMANADVAAVIRDGGLTSGWEHYQLFGQYESRQLGSNYCAGLAEFDAIAFDASDANDVVPCLVGRLQLYQKLFISGFNPAAPWLPSDPARSIIGGDLLVAYRPPRDWIGQRPPTAARSVGGNWPRLRRQDLYKPVAADGGAWPRISVVTVSYNQEPFIEETLRSVLEQNYPNLEYIVVDGGSNDGSVEIIKRHASQLSWWVSEKDGGQSEALNKGFKHATGEILTWLNSDDRLTPGSLYAVASAFIQWKPDLVAGRCARVLNHDPVPYHFHRCNLPLGRPVTLPLGRLLNLQDSWLKGDFFHQPEVFFSREIYNRAGGTLREDLYYSMDYDLWVRMAKAGASILPVPEVLAIFRQHGAQKTGGDTLPYLPELREVNASHLQDIEKTSVTKT